MTICFGAKVLSVVEVHEKTYVSGIGSEAIFESQPGWKVSLDEHTSTVFAARPELEPGQEIWVIWEPQTMTADEQEAHSCKYVAHTVWALPHNRFAIFGFFRNEDGLPIVWTGEVQELHSVLRGIQEADQEHRRIEDEQRAASMRTNEPATNLLDNI